MRQRCAALRVAFAFGRFFCFFSPLASESITSGSTFSLIGYITTPSTHPIAVARRYCHFLPSCPAFSCPCNRDVAFPARKPLHLPEHRCHCQPTQLQAVFLSPVPLRVVGLLNELIGERVDPRREAYEALLSILAPSSLIFLELFIEQLVNLTNGPWRQLTRQRSRHTEMIYPACMCHTS